MSWGRRLRSPQPGGPASGFLGWPVHAEPVGSVSMIGRICALHLSSPAGMWTGVPRYPKSVPRREVRLSHPRVDSAISGATPAVRASSDTGRFGAPSSPGGRLGIYGFGGSAHLTANSDRHGRRRPWRHDPGTGGSRAHARARCRQCGRRRTPRLEMLSRLSCHLVRAGGIVRVLPALEALDRGGISLANSDCRDPSETDIARAWQLREASLRRADALQCDKANTQITRWNSQFLEMDRCSHSSSGFGDGALWIGTSPGIRHSKTWPMTG